MSGYGTKRVSGLISRKDKKDAHLIKKMRIFLFIFCFMAFDDQLSINDFTR